MTTPFSEFTNLGGSNGSDQELDNREHAPDDRQNEESVDLNISKHDIRAAAAAVGAKFVMSSCGYCYRRRRYVEGWTVIRS